MAKISVVERNEKKQMHVAKFAAQRNALQKKLKNPQTTDEDFFRAEGVLTIASLRFRGFSFEN
jgi:small subunit ribosomal protein S14